MREFHTVSLYISPINSIISFCFRQWKTLAGISWKSENNKINLYIFLHLFTKMSFNQWKLLNLVKDIVTKFATDKSLPNPSELTNMLLQTIQKISPVAQKDILKILQSTNNVEKKMSSDKKNVDSQFLPELINKIGMSYKVENQTSITQRWKVKKISEVKLNVPLYDPNAQ